MHSNSPSIVRDLGRLVVSRTVAALDPQLQARLAGRNLVIFDGTCVLCSGFYRFVLRHDRANSLSFATAQSPLGQQLYQALGLAGDDFQTNIVIVQGKIFTHLDSFAAVMRVLGWPWRAIGFVRHLPQRLKLPLYAIIARNRFRLFGRFDRCMIPNAAARARFVEQGW